MSRSGYSDDCDNSTLGLWRGAVNSAIRGKRGQAMLRELAQALDDLPEKRLAPDSLVNECGEFCALGALGRKRGLDMEPIDTEDMDAVAKAFGVAEALAAEIMYLNDEYAADEYKWIQIEICGPMRSGFPDWGKHAVSVRVLNTRAAEQRWSFMRNWANENINREAVTP